MTPHRMLWITAMAGYLAGGCGGGGGGGGGSTGGGGGGGGGEPSAQGEIDPLPENTFLFMRTGESTARLYAYDVDRREERLITDFGDTSVMREGSISPDRRWFVFSAWGFRLDGVHAGARRRGLLPGWRDDLLLPGYLLGESQHHVLFQCRLRRLGSVHPRVLQRVTAGRGNRSVQDLQRW